MPLALEALRELQKKRRRLPVFLVSQDGAQQVKRRLTARPALLRVAARQLVLKAPFADVAIGLPAVLQVNAVGEAGRARPARWQQASQRRYSRVRQSMSWAASALTWQNWRKW